MKSALLFAASALLLTGCLPKAEQQVIVVDGEGVVMAAPDVFAVAAEVRAKGPSQKEALAEVAQIFSHISENLPRLENIGKIEINSSEAEIEPNFDSACVEQVQYRASQSCPIIGYAASIAFSVNGEPVVSSGPVIALLAQLGATELKLSGYSVADLDKTRADAAAQAMKNARQKAEQLAEAAGVTLGAAVRIQYGSGFGETDYSDRSLPDILAPLGEDEEIVVTGSRITPEVNLVLTPQPFEVRENVKAAFTIAAPSR